ncbi:MAG: hypothetical protein WA285_25175 [Mycobacterium sp.]
MKHIAIHGPRPRPDTRAHIAADRAHQEERDDRAASGLPGAAVSFGGCELLGDAVDIMAGQRSRQRW